MGICTILYSTDNGMNRSFITINNFEPTPKEKLVLLANFGQRSTMCIWTLSIWLFISKSRGILIFVDLCTSSLQLWFPFAVHRHALIFFIWYLQLFSRIESYHGYIFKTVWSYSVKYMLLHLLHVKVHVKSKYSRYWKKVRRDFLRIMKFFACIL